MKSRFYTTEAFTLTEVIVGMVVVTIIGGAAWMAVNVLSPASQATRLRIKAEHLITLSEEQLHQYAQGTQQVSGQTVFNFDTTLNNCNFDQPGNICGFPDARGQFPEFSTPTLTYIGADSTTDLKKFDIGVTWQELGKTQQKDSVILLVHPSAPLPGNIRGLVTNSSNGAILKNAQIVVRNVSTPSTNTTFSQAAPIPQSDGDKVNYTFAQPGTGDFVLGVGTWQLTATLAGYQNYPPQDIVITGSDDEEADIQMTPLLTPATISGNLVNGNGTGPQPSFSNNSIIQLDENGASPSNVSPLTFQGSSFSFNISFPNNNKRCFTLSTLKAYQSKWAGLFTCNGYSYQADGWSSAQANFSLSAFNCAENWEGDAASDSSGVNPVCVSPGDNLTNQNITLVQVPTATLTALVVDQNNNPVNASSTDPVLFDVYWHDGTFYNQQNYTASSDGQGHYLVTLPAEQDLFAAGDEALVLAQTNVPVQQCCNQTATVGRQSPVQRVGPLPPNQSTTFVINTATTAQQCGNADGTVNNAQTGASVSGANVSLLGLNQVTDGGGDYTFQCPNTPPFSVPAGNPNIAATGSGYYPFSSAGNAYYTATGRVNITADQPNNLGAIGLWPIGYSTITGTVVENDNGTNVGIGGVTVVLTQLRGTGGTLTATTNSDGTFAFNNVQETWLPPALVGNLKYNQTPLDDTLSVAATGSYGAYSGSPFALTAGTPYNATIVLTPAGGV